MFLFVSGGSGSDDNAVVGESLVIGIKFFLRDEVDSRIIGFKITGHFNDSLGDFSGIGTLFKNDKTFS